MLLVLSALASDPVPDEPVGPTAPDAVMEPGRPPEFWTGLGVVVGGVAGMGVGAGLYEVNRAALRNASNRTDGGPGVYAAGMLGVANLVGGGMCVAFGGLIMAGNAGRAPRAARGHGDALPTLASVGPSGFALRWEF